jgi:hypothetical protein
LPTLNFWTSIIPQTFVDTTPPPKKFPYSCTIQLTIYPDAMIGAQTSWVATLDAAGGILNSNTAAASTINGPAYFGIYQAPKPLLGEPIVSMPLNTTVDLSDGVSQPSFSQYPTPPRPDGSMGGYTAKGQLALAGYDILFSPSGQLMAPYGVGQVFLWVRNPTKGVANIAQLQIPNQYAPDPDQANPFMSISPNQPGFGSSYLSSAWLSTLPTGGEQLLVTIKANSGGTGVTPIYAPILATDTPYNYAMKAANLP